MAQQDEHLTTEQLSAFLDKQLSPPEQAVFAAHLASCQQCQSRLADLRVTVALVRALPQEEVPRSFVLPSRLAPVAEGPTRRPATVTRVPQQPGARVYVLQRTVRVVSTLAAVLALIFILSGLLPSHLAGGGASTASAPVSTNQSAASNGATAPHLQATATLGRTQAADGTRTPLPTPKPTRAPTVHSKTDTGTFSTVQPPTLPPFLDLSQPEGRLALGALLLVLSIIGLFVTRRRRGTVY